MIYDYHGAPLKRAPGFVGGYVKVTKILPVIDALVVVGFETPLVEEEDEEADAARNRNRMRRA